ncbi:MarR family winged helix-turn-helix transcriptional regulator [Kineococcus gynurae]|uniref:MarR family winged helix-turn-helix transcriptional regulator n=1 Tax=Kineococcus gynurae TaxID=452979 RepID=A0ABV5LQ25_9ACTN
MTQMYRPRDTPRRQLQAELLDEVRRIGLESQQVAHAFAESQSMHPTDLQALIHVMRAETLGAPTTAGELAALLRISTGAVTGVVDRLEQLGHLRRERDTTDRRRVHLHYGERGSEVATAFFGPLGRRSDEIMKDYDDTELTLVLGFLTRMADALAEHRQGLRDT